jgi:hypothetical protein
MMTPGQTFPDAAIADAGQMDTFCDADADTCETFGPAVCMADQNSASSDTCEARAICTQDVQTNGVVQRRSSIVTIVCERDPGSTFRCRCSGASTDESFPVMATGAWDACGLAIISCAERLEL